MAAHGALARAALTPGRPKVQVAPGELPRSLASSGEKGDTGGCIGKLSHDICGGTGGSASRHARTTSHDWPMPTKGAVPSLELSRSCLEAFDPDVYTTRGRKPLDGMDERARRNSSSHSQQPSRWERPRLQGETTSSRDFSAPPLESLREALRKAESPRAGHDWYRSRKFEGVSSAHNDYPPPPLEALLASYRAPRDDAAGVERERRSPAAYHNLQNEIALEDARRHRSVPPPTEVFPRGAPDDEIQRGSSLSGIAKARFFDESSMHVGFKPPQLVARSALANRAREKLSQDSEQELRESPSRRYSQAESTTHHDYRPPPLDALQAALHSSQAEENSAWRQRLQKYRFQGKSCTHQDFPPPPPEALRLAKKQSDGRPHADVYSAARAIFSGESTTHSDYPPLPLDALRTAFHQTDKGAESKEFKAAFAGESSTHSDFLPPPLDAIRAAHYFRPSCHLQPSGERAKLEGESTTHHENLPPPSGGFFGESSMHHDYKPPPIEALRESFRLSAMHRATSEDTERIKFQGESSTHRDFPPPPSAASRAGIQPNSNETNRYSWFSERAKFEGHSTFNHDFPPPPLQAFRDALAGHQSDGADHAFKSDVKFEGESSTHMDFKAPPPSAFRADSVVGLQKPSNRDWQERRIFTGESSTHRDYQPPSLDALRETFRLSDAHARATEETFHNEFRFEGKSTTHTDFPPQVPEPLQRQPQREMAYDAYIDKPRFEGESSTHRDFLPPPLDALRNALAGHQSDAANDFARDNMKFEGESSTHMDFKAPPPSAFRADSVVGLQKPSNRDWQERGIFTGESSTHRDYQPPSLDALRETFRLSDAHARATEETFHNEFRFEGKSTTHTDFPPQVPEPLQREAQSEMAYDVYVKKPRFEGESSTHRDFLPPPMEALRESLSVHQSDELCHSEKDIMKFEAESVTHRDYKPPPPSVCRADVVQDQRKPSNREWQAQRIFTGESPTHRDFLPPPMDALREVFSVHNSDRIDHLIGRDVKFEGESLSHSDFKAPPASAIRAKIVADVGNRVDKEPQERNLSSATRFEGESSTHRDFTPPPLDALRNAFAGHHLDEANYSVRDDAKFEGESSTHRDFKAPPPNAFRIDTVANVQIPSNKDWHGRGIFTGESSTHRDFQPPSLDALRATFEAAESQASLFASKVTKHDESEASMRPSFEPPHTASSIRREVAPVCAKQREPQNIPFTGESTSHRDYKPPTMDALRSAFEVPRSRVSLTAGFGTPRGSQRRASSEKGAFKGQSSMHRDFTPPPREAFLAAFRRETTPRERETKETKHFEGRSSSHTDFAPPSRESLMEAFRCGRQVRSRDQSPRGEPRLAFEGKSTSHSDFRSQPLESVLAAGRSTPTRHGDTQMRARIPSEEESSRRREFNVPVSESFEKAYPRKHNSSTNGVWCERQSSTHQDFLPPSREALLSAFESRASLDERRKSVGQRRAFSEDPSSRRMSLTHHDFAPPPREALLAAFQNEKLEDARKQRNLEGLKVRFQDESRMQQHAVSTPQEVLKHACQTPRTQTNASDRIKFEGQSSTHRDFTPPPLDTRQKAAGRPARQNKENADPRKNASSRPLEVVYKQQVFKFEDQHPVKHTISMRPPDLVNQGALARESQKQEGFVHVGSSSDYSDAHVGTNASRDKSLPAGCPTKSNDEKRSKSAPRERSQQDSKAAGFLLGGSNRNALETTSRHDFKPVLSLNAPPAGKPIEKNQRSRSTPADSRPAMAFGGIKSQPPQVFPMRAPAVHSLTHQNFTPPARGAHDEPLKRVGVKKV